VLLEIEAVETNLFLLVDADGRHGTLLRLAQTKSDTAAMVGLDVVDLVHRAVHRDLVAAHGCRRKVNCAAEHDGIHARRVAFRLLRRVSVAAD
jgi:hypothetical protein